MTPGAIDAAPSGDELPDLIAALVEAIRREPTHREQMRVGDGVHRAVTAYAAQVARDRARISYLRERNDPPVPYLPTAALFFGVPFVPDATLPPNVIAFDYRDEPARTVVFWSAEQVAAATSRRALHPREVPVEGPRRWLLSARRYVPASLRTDTSR